MDEKFILNKFIEISKELISKNTVNPPGNEFLAKPIVEKYLRELNMSIEFIEKEKNRTNIIGKLVLGNGPSLAIVTHTDVVPVGDDWDRDPFMLTEDSEKFYGRGILDDKGPFALSYLAIKHALDKGLKKGTIYFLAVADEERGSEKGMTYLLENGFKSDYAFIPDGGDINDLIIGEKGVIILEIESIGKQAHGSTPEMGVNAITNICKLINNIEKKINELELNFDKRFSKTSLNVGQISGGSAPNMVPAKAKVVLDIRYPGGINKEDILKEIDLVISQTENTLSNSSFSKKLIQYTEPHILDSNNRLIKVFKDVAQKNNIKLSAITIGGNTVAKQFYKRGIPSVVHYPCKKDHDVAHISNEYLHKDLIIPAVRLWGDFIYNILNE